MLESHAEEYLDELVEMIRLAGSKAALLVLQPTWIELPPQASFAECQLLLTGDPADPSVPCMKDFVSHWLDVWPPATRAGLAEIQTRARALALECMPFVARYPHIGRGEAPDFDVWSLVHELGRDVEHIHARMSWWERDVGNFRRRRTRAGMP